MASDKTEEQVLRDTLDGLVRDGVIAPHEAKTDEARTLVRQTSLYQWSLLRARLVELGCAIRDAMPTPIRRWLGGAEKPRR